MGLLSAAFFSAAAAIGETFSVKSPDGKLEAVLNDGDQITFSLMADGKEILKDAPIGMDTDKGKIGSGAKSKRFQPNLAQRYDREQLGTAQNDKRRVQPA